MPSRCKYLTNCQQEWTHTYVPHVHHMSTCRLLMHATFGSRLKVVTFTVLVRLVKSKRSASDLVPYHISAQLILLTYYSRYIGGTAVDRLSAVISSIPKACENQLCNHADQNPLSVVYVNIRISWNTGVCISGRD